MLGMLLKKKKKEERLLLFSCSVVTNSSWPHGLPQARFPWPSLSPGVCSNSCPLSWWCHPTISSFVTPFSSGLQSSPGTGSFPMCRLFASGGQSIGVSPSILPMNIQGSSPLGLTGLISLLPKGLLKSPPALQFKSISSPVLSLLIGPTLTSVSDYWKNHSFDYMDLCQQSDISAFNNFMILKNKCYLWIENLTYRLYTNLYL